MLPAKSKEKKSTMSKSKGKRLTRIKRMPNTSIQLDESLKKNEQGSSYRSLMLRKAEAVDLLNGNRMPASFRFREKEMQRISAFLDACVKEEKRGVRFLMLTGAPGAGKSLCTNTLLSKYECKVIKMNANVVKTLQEVQLLISTELLGEIGTLSYTAPKILSLLEEAQYNKVCVVYIEEVELLFKNDPNPITEDFMKLFQKKGLRLILIGISNTIDTLLKSSSKFCFKMHDVENIIFSPYTGEHIAEIMKDKIAEVRTQTELEIVLSDRLLKYSSQKLETLKKGDFRVCLEFLKSVVQRVLEKGQPEGSCEAKGEVDLQGETRDRGLPEIFTIDIVDVNTVLGKMNVSKNQVIDGLPYQQKVMLIAIYTYFHKTDALCVSQMELQPEVRWICDSLQIAYSKQLMSEGLCQLEQYSLVELKQKQGGQKIMLKVALSEIEDSFHDHFIFKKFFNST